MDAIRELQAIVQEQAQEIANLKEALRVLDGRIQQLAADLEIHEATQYGVHGGNR